MTKEEKQILESGLKIQMIFSNPFYCMTVDKIFVQKHKPMVSKEQWVKSNVILIKEIGAEKWLESLISNLEGNYLR